MIQLKEALINKNNIKNAETFQECFLVIPYSYFWDYCLKNYEKSYIENYFKDVFVLTKKEITALLKDKGLPSDSYVCEIYPLKFKNKESELNFYIDIESIDMRENVLYDSYGLNLLEVKEIRKIFL